MTLTQRGLGIEQIDVRGRSRLEEVDHPLGLRPRRGGRTRLRGEAIPSQERSERDSADAHRAPVQEAAARELERVPGQGVGHRLFTTASRLKIT